MCTNLYGCSAAHGDGIVHAHARGVHQRHQAQEDHVCGCGCSRRLVAREPGTVRGVHGQELDAEAQYALAARSEALIRGLELRTVVVINRHRKAVVQVVGAASQDALGSTLQSGDGGRARDIEMDEAASTMRNKSTPQLQLDSRATRQCPHHSLPACVRM